MSDYLAELVVAAHRRVAEARERQPLDALREQAEATVAPPPFAAALADEGVAVIAELKRASPSRGELAPDLDALTQARAYVGGGAAAISVLTERAHFGGSLEDLRTVAGCGAPALRKDIIVDPYQVWEARAAGASAVLVIVAALDDGALEALMAACRRAGVEALVEVHDAPELERARALDPTVIGVNARDLHTFEIDRGAFAGLRDDIPTGVVAVDESGIAGPADVTRAGRQGADAVLVGEALVTAQDPKRAVAELVAAGRGGA